MPTPGVTVKRKENGQLRPFLVMTQRTNRS